MVQIICAVVSGVASVVVALVGIKVTKTNKETEQRAERRKAESMLMLELVVASVDLTEVCANALTGGHNNGNVKVARDNVEKARQKYKELQRTIVAEEIV